MIGISGHPMLYNPDEYECSRCHRTFTEKYQVCPNCGSSLYMEREEQDWVDEAEELSWIMDDD